MRRRPLLPIALAALAAAAPAADAAAPMNLGSGRVSAFAAGGGQPYSVLDANSARGPFTLKRGRTTLGRFAGRDAEFPDVAVRGTEPVVTWGVPISGGEAIYAGTLRDARDLGFGTGPAKLAATPDGVFAAFPDRDGDIVLADTAAERRDAYDLPSSRALSENAPERRHLALDAAAGPDGVLVLDLVQTRNSTELRVIGPGAPSRPVLAIGKLADIEATLAADARGISVAYMSAGRAVLASSRGGAWSRRRLPGPGRGEGAPAVARTGGRVVVAYEQRREIHLWNNGRARVAASGPGTDRVPHAASSGSRVWIAWTHRSGAGRAQGRLLRVR